MELTLDEARARRFQHRIILAVLFALAFSMWMVLAAKSAVDLFLGPHTPGPVARLLRALQDASSLPVVAFLWPLAPDVDGQDPAVYLLSPYVWVAMVLTGFAIWQRTLINRLSGAIDPVRIVANGPANHIGNVWADGNVSIVQGIHDKPAERPLATVLLTTLVSGITSDVFALIQASMGL